MAIMDQNIEVSSTTFDNSSFLLSHNHDFIQHSTMSKDNDHLHRNANSHSPPGDLSLSQLHGLDSDWAIQRHGDSNGQPSPPNSSIAHDSQHSSGRNSLGLLGGGFSQSNSASPQASHGESMANMTQNRQLGNAFMHAQQPQAFQTQQQQLHTGVFAPTSFHQPEHGFGVPSSWYGSSAVPSHMLQHASASLHRQQSSSSLSDASTSSVLNDGASVESLSQHDPTSPVRNSFTPLQSPMGLTHSISSLAGLAIGTPQQNVMQPSALEDYLNSCQDGNFSHHGGFTCEGDQQLLSLSDGFHGFGHADLPNSAPVDGNTNQLMAPPAAASASRRRSTGVAHSLYTSQVRQLRQEMQNSDDVTPMPSSHQKFIGQPSSSEVSDMASFTGQVPARSTTSSEPIGDMQSQRLPMTPRNVQRSIHQIQHQQHPPSTMPPSYGGGGGGGGGVGNLFNAVNASPADDSSAMGSSITDSGFSAAPRLNRMDSFDSFTSGSAISTPSSEAASARTSSGTTGRSLEATIAEHEAKLAAAHAAAAAAHTHTPARQRQMQLPQTPQSVGAGDRTISPNSAASSVYETPSSSSMARIASAPVHAMQLQQQRTQNAPGGAVPTTPVRSSPVHEMHYGYPGSQPFTPHQATGMPAISGGFQTPQGQVFSHRIHELTMSAPQMVASRSMSSLPSPGLMHSPLSPVDVRQQQHHGHHHQMSASLSNVFGSPDSVADDGQIRSPSGGVARTGTPRSRGRNAAPPPLIVSSADKLHVCYCGKRFKRLEHLKRHNRVHTQERPHACPAPGCNKWFGRTDNLTQHLKTHYRTLGRTSESLLQITQAAAAAKASGPEARGLTSSAFGANNNGSKAHMIEDGNLVGPPAAADMLHHDARHDPHAAAAAAAARAVSKTNMKRRTTLSNDMLGGPITLDDSPANESRPSSRSPNAPLTVGLQHVMKS